MSALARVTVNLTPPYRTDLETAQQTTGENQTDTISHAIRLYRIIRTHTAVGGTVTLTDPDGTARKVEFL